MRNYQFKIGDTVRVKELPTTSRTNGRPWPADWVECIEGYSWADEEPGFPMYVVYGADYTRGIQFAEADLELVETLEQRRAAVPTTQETMRQLRIRIDQLEGVLRQIRLHLPNTDERGRLHPGDYYLIEAIEEMVKAALPEGPEQQ